MVILVYMLNLKCCNAVNFTASESSGFCVCSRLCNPLLSKRTNNQHRQCLLRKLRNTVQTNEQLTSTVPSTEATQHPACCVATSDDCTESIQETAPVEWEALLLLCQGQEICSVENAERVLTTCDNSPNNYLIINYSCLPGIASFTHGPVAAIAGLQPDPEL